MNITSLLLDGNVIRFAVEINGSLWRSSARVEVGEMYGRRFRLVRQVEDIYVGLRRAFYQMGYSLGHLRISLNDKIRELNL